MPIPPKTLPQRIAAFIAKRLTLATGASLVAVFIFARFSAEFSEQGNLQAFDQAVLAFCAEHRVEPLYQFAAWVSWLSQPVAQVAFVGVAVVAFAVWRRFKPQGASLLLASLSGALVIAGLKYLFHRPRPLERFDALGYSFPFGHTFMAVIVYGTLAYWLARELTGPRRWLTWLVGVTGMLLVGWSRIYLGEHFPSDVGAAYSAAFAWLWFCLSVTYRFSTPKSAG